MSWGCVFVVVVAGGMILGVLAACFAGMVYFWESRKAEEWYRHWRESKERKGRK